MSSRGAVIGPEPGDGPRRGDRSVAARPSATLESAASFVDTLIDGRALVFGLLAYKPQFGLMIPLVLLGSRTATNNATASGAAAG